MLFLFRAYDFLMGTQDCCVVEDRIIQCRSALDREDVRIALLPFLDEHASAVRCISMTAYNYMFRQSLWSYLPVSKLHNGVSTGMI